MRLASKKIGMHFAMKKIGDEKKKRTLVLISFFRKGRKMKNIG